MWLVSVLERFVRGLEATLDRVSVSGLLVIGEHVCPNGLDHVLGAATVDLSMWKEHQDSSGRYELESFEFIGRTEPHRRMGVFET